MTFLYIINLITFPKCLHIHDFPSVQDERHELRSIRPIRVTLVIFQCPDSALMEDS